MFTSKGSWSSRTCPHRRAAGRLGHVHIEGQLSRLGHVHIEGQLTDAGLQTVHAEPFAEVGTRHLVAAVVLPGLAHLHVVQTLHNKAGRSIRCNGIQYNVFSQGLYISM